MPEPDMIMSLLVVAMVGLSAWASRRSGQANPVGTARLQSDISWLRGEVNMVKQEIKTIRREVSDAPSMADHAELKGDLKALAVQITGVAGHAESIDSAVVRIEMALTGLSPATPRARRKA